MLNPSKIRGKKRTRISNDFEESTFPTPVPLSASTPRIRTVPVPDANESQLGRQLLDLSKIVQDLAGVVGKTSSTTHRQQLVLKSDIIPVFDPESSGSCIEKWLSKIDDFRVIYHWTEEITTYNALTKLVGLAKSWYDSLIDIHYTWDEWKEQLRRAFPSQTDYCQLLRKILAREKQPQETYLRYYYDKLALLNLASISDKNAVSCIIGGLTESSIRAAARAGNYEIPETLLGFLKTIESTASRSTGTEHSKRFSKDFKHSRTMPYTRKNNIKCFLCKKEGHKSPDCPNKTKQKPCSFCHKMGHEEKQCYSKQNQQKGTTGKTTLLINNKDSNLKYFKQAFVNDVPCQSYVDMGSSCTAIRESNVNDLGLTINTEDKTVIIGYGGASTTTLGSTKFLLKVDEVEHQIKANVVPDTTQEVPLLIGQTFTDMEGVMAIKDDKQLFFKKGNITSIQSKIPLWATETAVIPPNHGGFVEVRPKYNVSGDYLIEFSLRMKEGQEHFIPNSIVTIEDKQQIFVPVVNLSEADLIIDSKFPLVRAQMCCEAKGEAVLRTTEAPLVEITKTDVKCEIREEKVIHRLLQLLNRYRHCFAYNLAELGESKSTKMEIKLNDQTPFMYRPYRMSQTEKTQTNEIVNELLRNGIIQESNSEYASPVILVRKKNGQQRMCVDFRKLNSKSLKQRFPLPRIDDLIDQLQGMTYFTTLDLFSGYHQVQMDESSRRLTSFVVPDGQYEYKRMPFGLCNAPSVFQRLMYKVFGAHKELATIYLDDVLISSKTIEEHFDKLEKALILLEKEGLTLNPAKCTFFSTNITYLGYEISREGVKPNREKTEAVEKFPVPSNVHQVRQFVGLTGYFRQFIPRYGLIAKPLTMLTRKNVEFSWKNDQQLAFDELKTILTTRPTLAIYDPQAELEVHCDACQNGLAGILLQKESETIHGR